jgi:hypothetical protein
MSLYLSLTGPYAARVQEQYKTLKYVLGGFMLRRTKSKLIELGTLVLPCLIEITVFVLCQIFDIFYSYRHHVYIFYENRISVQFANFSFSFVSPKFMLEVLVQKLFEGPFY